MTRPGTEPRYREPLGEYSTHKTNEPVKHKLTVSTSKKKKILFQRIQLSIQKFEQFSLA